MSTWGDLQELRNNGLRPSMPLVITDDWWRAQAFADAGCMVIVHRESELLVPTRLLEGLAVILLFKRCDGAFRYSRACSEAGVRPCRMLTWCACAQQLSAFPQACERVGRAVA